MEIKSLEELQRPDDRLLQFAPRGLAGGAEAAVRYHQELVNQFSLAAPVPERVRMAYERLQTVYVYGALSYELFGVAHDQARLTLEYALRERFMDYHGSTVPFVDDTDALQTLYVASFEDLFEQIRQDDRLRKPKRWRLRLSSGDKQYFDGMLDSLIRWARAEGILFGQVNRRHEDLLKRARNRAAHAAGYKLLPPNYAAAALADLAEIINRLWGVTAPSGRLYPGPVRRTTVAVAWSQNGERLSLIVADQLRTLSPSEGGQLSDVILVRGDKGDDGLFNFDALYEGTHSPAEWLWGPGDWKGAVAWFDQHQPEDDEVALLDRVFVVRLHDSRLYLPQQADVAAALDPSEQVGTWYMSRADSPTEVFNHLRQALAGRYKCRWTPGQPCRECPVEMITSGQWNQVVGRLAALGQSVQPRAVPDVRVPGGWPRWNVIEDGGWSIPPSH